MDHLVSAVRRMLRLRWTSVLALAVVVSKTAGQGVGTTSDERLIAALRSYIPYLMKQAEAGVPGLSIAVARRSGVIWEEGFGYADLEKRTPMTATTVTHSGSMGKAYVGTAIMQLAERGVFQLDDPINKYLKEFQVVNPLGDREITFRDLLTHRTGLAGNAAGSDFARPLPLGEHLERGYATKYHDWWHGAVVQKWSAKVGEKFQYSNFGLATLGYLVEVSNPERSSFSDYVQKHIMDPLGMKSSQYPPVQDSAHVRPDIYARFSKGYARLGTLYVPTPAIYFADYPAGTVVTTPGDHLRLLLAYMNGGTYNGYQLLKPETVKLMLSPQVTKVFPNADLGLIWFLRNAGKKEAEFGHGGAHMYGWDNDFRAFPELDIAFATFTNHWDMINLVAIHQRVADFLVQWHRYEGAGGRKPIPPRSWAWKTSYVAGLIMVENMKGQLGIASPLTNEMIAAMVKGARPIPGRPGDATRWDAEGFRAGVEDMLKVEMTPEAVRAFLESDRMRIAPEELDILYREIGGRSAYPKPTGQSRN